MPEACLTLKLMQAVIWQVTGVPRLQFQKVWERWKVGGYATFNGRPFATFGEVLLTKQETLYSD